MKHTKQLYALLLCLSLLFSLALPAFASEAETESEEQVEWSVSDDQSALYYGDEFYGRIKLRGTNWLRPYVFYQYNQDMETDNNMVDCIGRPATYQGDELVLHEDMVVVFDFLSSYADIRVYVKDEAVSQISSFVTGEYAKYELAEGYYHSGEMDASTVERWNAQGPDSSVDATVLGDLTYYYVLGYDSTLTIAHVVGAVFERDGEYLYVHYDTLGNNYFDADGELSFRGGDVPVLRVGSADAATVVSALENATNFEVDVTYEPQEPLNATIAFIVFLLLASPLLYLLPIGLAVLGIIMSRIKRTTHPARWKAVIILSTVWLVLAILLSALLVIPTFFL